MNLMREDSTIKDRLKITQKIFKFITSVGIDLDDLFPHLQIELKKNSLKSKFGISNPTSFLELDLDNNDLSETQVKNIYNALTRQLFKSRDLTSLELSSLYNAIKNNIMMEPKKLMYEKFQSYFIDPPSFNYYSKAEWLEDLDNENELLPTKDNAPMVYASQLINLFADEMMNLGKITLCTDTSLEDYRGKTPFNTNNIEGDPQSPIINYLTFYSDTQAKDLVFETKYVDTKLITTIKIVQLGIYATHKRLGQSWYEPNTQWDIDEWFPANFLYLVDEKIIGIGRANKFAINWIHRNPMDVK